jgi:hypothetical protein
VHVVPPRHSRNRRPRLKALPNDLCLLRRRPPTTTLRTR